MKPMIVARRRGILEWLTMLDPEIVQRVEVVLGDGS
jgi:hypothetical protein